MPKKETSKYFYILSIIGALLVIAIAVGSSYAFFTNTKTHSTATVITSGSLTLELNDGAVVGTTQNMIPGDSITKSFSVTNTSNQALAYDIYLSEIFNNFADKSDLVYSINSTDGGYNTSNDIEVPSEVGLQSKIIDSHVINAGDTQNYTLTIKFLSKNKNQDNNKGKSFSAKIQINDYTSYKIAMLKKGEEVNNIMESITSSKSNIISVRRATSLDENATKEVVSTPDSNNDIYMWYGNHILYYYTDASRIYLNEDSSYLFYYLNNATSIDMEIFDTSNVTDMSYMFYDNNDLLELDLSNFNTSGVTNMDHMFYYCQSLTNLDLNNFNTSNVENMKGMFIDCESLTGLDLSNFDTSNVTDMSNMFEYCYSLKNLNLTNFDTSNVTNMNWMFHNSPELTNLDLSSFDTSNVEIMAYMFYDCYELKTIYVSELWDTSLVTSDYGMFSDCSQLVGGKGTVYNSNYTKIDYAHVDEGVSNPGYLTYKASPDSGKSITITLHPGEGSLSNTTINTKIGQFLGELPIPTISNSDLEFIGWYSNSEFKNQVTSSTRVSKKMTNLYAKYNYKLNANGYNYWVAPSIDYRGYTATSVPNIVYPNYTYLITDNNPTFIRTTYVNGNPNGHEACVYYNNNVFCIAPKYWESIIGSDDWSSANGTLVRDTLKNEMETALGKPVDHCTTSSSHAFCYYDDIYCGTNLYIDSIVFCAKTSDANGCIIYYQGDNNQDAYCDHV